MAIIQNYTVRKNADFEFAARWESDGVPYILSAAEMKVRREDTDGELIHLYNGSGGSTTVGNITLDGVDGWATVVIAEEDWIGESYTGIGNYDLVVTRQSDDRTKVLMAGEMIIKTGQTY